MNRVQSAEIEQRAFDYFQSGFNCAEALFKTIVELFAGKPGSDVTKVASGFGGGIGGSKEEACGALMGGIIALGWLWGRVEPKDDKKRVYELASEFRQRFVDAFGSSSCRSILEGLGEQENMMKCKKLTGRAAGILLDMLEDVNPKICGPV